MEKNKIPAHKKYKEACFNPGLASRQNRIVKIKKNMAAPNHHIVNCKSLRGKKEAKAMPEIKTKQATKKTLALKL